MGENIRGGSRTLSPKLWAAIWAGVTLAVLGVVAAGVRLAVREEAKPPVETLLTAQVTASVPRFAAADPSFNGTGVAVLTGGVGRDVAVDGQGRVVVLGSAEVEGVPRVAVWRLSPAGRLDPAFGTGGASLVPSAFPAGQQHTVELGQALALDEQGRIVIAGFIQDPEGWMKVAVWRLTPDGSPDREFHGNGRVVLGTALEPGPDYLGKAVALDVRGRIVVAGSSRALAIEGRSLQESLGVWRLTDSGQLDTAFHGSGTLKVPDTRGNALALDRAGRIVVAGATLGPQGGWSLAVWRFLSDGSADPQWNEGAVLTPELPGGALPMAAADVAVAPDGKVVVLGVVYDPHRPSDEDLNGIQQVGLWRFLADGTPDPAFTPGSGGAAIISGSAGDRGRKTRDFGRALDLDAQGRILVAGLSRDRQGRRLLAVWRRTPSGAVDRAWSPDGVAVQGTPPATQDDQNAVAAGLTADAQGRVLVTGAASDGKQRYLAVWRIKP